MDFTLVVPQSSQPLRAPGGLPSGRSGALSEHDSVYTYQAWQQRPGRAGYPMAADQTRGLRRLRGAAGRGWPCGGCS
ncbi:MAG: hypothetical protein ACLSUM_14405 [Dysosmobacter welbionis]